MPPAPVPVDREIRFALAMNGGVSLAVWIGGVSDEVLRLCVAGSAADGFGLDAPAPERSWSVYQQLCWAAHARVRVDVMSGASAGGMNAVFLALAWLYQKRDLGELRDLWLSAGDIAALLRDPLDADATSLMMGDDYFLPRLEEALRSLATGEARDVVDAPLDVTLTATSMVGLPKRYAQKYGDPVEEQDHRVTMRFRHRMEQDDLATNDPAERERIVQRLARACRSTASFPGAFEPSLAAVSGPSGDGPRGAFARNQVNVPGETWVIDGGTLVNLPVEEALAAVFEMPATGAVRRVFAMIVPDPSVATPADASKGAGDAPGLITVVTHALSTIPRNQMVGQFLSELEEQNHKVQSLRTSRLALVTGPWEALWQWRPACSRCTARAGGP